MPSPVHVNLKQLPAIPAPSSLLELDAKTSYVNLGNSQAQNKMKTDFELPYQTQHQLEQHNIQAPSLMNNPQAQEYTYGGYKVPQNAPPEAYNPPLSGTDFDLYQSTSNQRVATDDVLNELDELVNKAKQGQAEARKFVQRGGENDAFDPVQTSAKITEEQIAMWKKPEEFSDVRNIEEALSLFK